MAATESRARPPSSARIRRPAPLLIAAIPLAAMLLAGPAQAQDAGQQDFEDTLAGAEDATREATGIADAATAMIESLAAPPARSFPAHLEPALGDSPEAFTAPLQVVIAQLGCDTDTPGTACSFSTPDTGSFLGTARRMAGGLLFALAILALVFAGLRIALGLESPVAALWKASSGIFIAWVLLLFWFQPFLGMTLELPAGYSGASTHEVDATIPVMLGALPLWVGSSVDAGFGDAWELVMQTPSYGFTLGRFTAEGLIHLLVPRVEVSEDGTWAANAAGWAINEFVDLAVGSTIGVVLALLFTVLVGLFLIVILLYVVFKAFSQYILAEIFVLAYGAIGILFVPFYVLPATRFLFTGWLKTYISVNLYALLTKLLAGVALALISGQMRHGIEWLQANPDAQGAETLSFAMGNLFMLVLIAVSSSQLLSAAGPFASALASGSAAAPPSGGGPLLTMAAGAGQLAATVATAGAAGAASALAPGALAKIPGLKNALPKAK